MNQPRKRAAESGFTLVEAMITATLLAIILAAVANTTTVATRSTEENVASAESITQCRRYLERVAKLVLPAKMSTLKMPATQADVAALLAGSVGEWIEAPGDTQWRNGIQFLAATGTESMNAMLSTSTRALEFTLEPTESANGVDDDEDGLVDEGTVSLLHEGVIVHVLHGVEICSFQLTDRLLAIRMRCGFEKNGRTHRADLTQRIFLRNN
jgi:type II secretory pathway pseudopilin PulG